MNNKKQILHQLDPNNQEETLGNRGKIVLFTLAILFGLAVGYGLRLITNQQNYSSPQNNLDYSGKKTVGIIDKSTFKDNAEGILREGGINGEGSFHLERPGGPSQNVYLTSSTVDLKQFIGKKVKVWGETFSAEKAGWLMDVGFIELL